jgi:hypothetical protein
MYQFIYAALHKFQPGRWRVLDRLHHREEAERAAREDDKDRGEEEEHGREIDPPGPPRRR